MYDHIFDDFNVIKEHCRTNGNIAFEEELVFELLEKYFPKYGSLKSIQKVLDMLDAQRIRENISNDNEDKNDNVGSPMDHDDSDVDVEIKHEKENVDESSIDNFNNESNDSDSIIEVAVPKKVHPFIDLTSNSPMSDIFIEGNTNESVKHEDSNNNSENESDDNYLSDNYDHDSSDPDITRHVNNDYITVESICKSPMLDLLACLDDTTNKSNNDNVDPNSNNADLPEILEENNNDPNNNLEGAIFEESMPIDNTMDNSVQEVQTVNAFGNSNSNNSVIEEMIDSIPGCSKDTDRDVIKRIFTYKRNLPSAHSPLSPVAGCSKDFPETILGSSDESEVDDSTFDNNSMQEDIDCIQEIIPWAETNTIVKILKKYRNSSNRKQLTLWDLMSQQSNKSTSKNKRKHEESNPSSATGSPKKAKNAEQPNDELVELVSSNESSSEMPSSIRPEMLEPNFKATNANQNNEKATTSIPIKEQMKRDADAAAAEATTSKQENCPHNSQNNLKNYLPTLNEQSGAIKKFKLASDVSDKDSFPIHRPSNKIEDELMASTEPIRNALSKDLEQIFQASRSFSSAEKSCTIVKPAKLTASTQSMPVKVSRPLDLSPVRPAKLNFLDLAYSLGESVNRNGIAAPLPTAKYVLPPNSKWPSDKGNGTLQENRPRPPDHYKLLATEAKNLDQKIIKPSTINQPPVPAMRRTATITNNRGLLGMQAAPTATATSGAVINPAHNSLKSLLKVKAPTFVPPIRIVSTSNGPAVVPVAEPPIHVLSVSRPSSSTINGAATVAATEPLLRVITTPRPTSTMNNGLAGVAAAQSSTSEAAAAKVQMKKVEVPNSIYVKLRSMFPEVKKHFIKSICSNPPFQLSSSNPEYILNVLIDYLLREGSNNLEVRQMQPFEVEEPASALTVDEKYEYLVGIFPNADPTYLREFVEKETTTDQVIEAFIQQKIEKHDYPTKEDYLKKIKATEQIRQYTVNFNVEKFLELFPDPLKHFEDANRQGTYQTIAMEFLKSFFNRHKVCTLNRFYRMNQYNLSLTAKALTSIGSDMKSKRGNSEMPTENIPLLQEIAFVKNKKNIIDHIERLKTQEEKCFKELKDQGLLLTCLCCYNDECMPTKSSECNSGHVFCYECINRGTEAALADGNAHVSCFTECRSEFSLATLQKVLSPTKFSTLLKKRQAAEVMAAGVEGLVSCPFCYFASIPPLEDKVFKCLNPECMKETCRMCRELNHVPLRCDEVVKTDRARLMIEEKMTEALLRTCYQCKKQFYKEEGCNRMSCPCGASMCYVCDKPVKGYDHFNAQGGANSNLCPLWSDDRRLNAEAVRKVAEDVKNNILKQNPNLKIDTEKLLPKLPPKSKGPHDDIPNANQIPEHVRRVANAAP